MEKERLAAFSDGVIAVIITIMVLELKPPSGANWSSLLEFVPGFLSYVLSFVYVAIYWNNHHHLLQTLNRVNGAILWANMHLLFWLSLIPLATAWLREHPMAAVPVAFYGFVLLLCAVAWFILQKTILESHGASSLLQRAIGKDMKGKISPILYAAGILFSFISPVVANVIYASVAGMWLIPDKRIEKVIE